ncbi:MAG: hypothetical protein ABEI54_01775 [Candidatus Bipolaricaulia bacterium]
MRNLGPKELFKRFEDLRNSLELDVDEFVHAHLGIEPHQYRDWRDGKGKPSKEVHNNMEERLIELEENQNRP